MDEKLRILVESILLLIILLVLLINAFVFKKISLEDAQYYSAISSGLSADLTHRIYKLYKKNKT